MLNGAEGTLLIMTEVIVTEVIVTEVTVTEVTMIEIIGSAVVKGVIKNAEKNEKTPRQVMSGASVNSMQPKRAKIAKAALR